VAAALLQARTDGLLILIDFFADWCGPCIALEKDIFPDPGIQEILKGYRLVRVNADELPEVANNYRVVAMPTLVVLGCAGPGAATPGRCPDGVESLLRDLTQFSRHGADEP
jgi:thioredoxin-like negative regulator of GroEL